MLSKTCCVWEYQKRVLEKGRAWGNVGIRE